MTDNLDVNISHSFFVPVPGLTDIGSFKSIVKAGIPGAILYDPAVSYEQPHIRDLQTAESFLHGGGQTYAVCRFFLESLRLELTAAGLSGWCALLSFFPEVSVVSLSFHYSIKNITTDKLIVLRQSGENKKYPFPEGNRSCAELAASLCGAMGVDFAPVERGFLCEITRFGEYTDIDLIEKEQACRLYGIITGDEGYDFVPRELAEKRLQYRWGSRSFMRVYAFGQGFLFLNLIGSPAQEKYLEHQHAFGSAAYGGCNPYFQLGSCPLTVNHGVMFSVEFVLMLKALIDGVLASQGEYNRKKGESFYKRIRETRDFRRKIIVVLERVEDTAITEIGELSSVLLESQHIFPVVDQVKYLLELLDGDLNLMYSGRSNALVTALTVLGLVLAALQVVLAVI